MARDDGIHPEGTVTQSYQCVSCVHYLGGGECYAFPAGIPEAIMSGRFDHSEPYPEDQGIRFEKIPGIVEVYAEPEE